MRREVPLDRLESAAKAVGRLAERVTAAAKTKPI
jgi:hypothetical protein